MNAGKTKFMAIDQQYWTKEGPSKPQQQNGTELEEINNFKFLGARMESTEKDIKIWKAAAWRAKNLWVITA